MSFAAAIRADLLTSSFNHNFRVCPLRLSRKQKKLALAVSKEREYVKLAISAILGNRRPIINGSGAAAEPPQIVLECLFAKTHKAEEQMNRDARVTEDIQVDLNLENLESDLHPALFELKKKEEGLQDGERIVLVEHDELERAKENVEKREKELAAVAFKQEQLEVSLKNANLNLVSKTRQIEDLKLLIKERDQCIAAAQSALDLKQREVDSMRNELVAKGTALTCMNLELASKAHFLNEANEVIKKQDLEIQELYDIVQKKERKVKVLVEHHMRDKEKLKVTEDDLKIKTTKYLVAHEEMKKMAIETLRNMEETNTTMEEFEKVKKLLADIRSELVASQNSISLSRENLKYQELLLEGQLAEFEKQKASLTSYFTSLKDAHVEIESERIMFTAATARNSDLEVELSVKKKRVDELEQELKNEKHCLQQALREVSILKEELDRKSKELEEAYSSLQLKDAELVDAKLEIQHLHSKQSSLNLILNEKDAELLSTGKRLEEVTKEVLELQMLVSREEDNLVQASNMLKKKDTHLEVMRHELNDLKLKYVDAENAVQRILDLTNELVTSAKDKDFHSTSQLNEYEVKVLQHSSESDWERKQLEEEIILAREDLRTREKEVHASQRALATKDEQLYVVPERLDVREKELRTAKDEIAQETDELRKLHTLAQERIGEKSIGDLAIEKLQLEAAQLDTEAAITALSKLVELGEELLNSSTLASTISLSSFSTSDTSDNLVDLSGVKTEVARLTALTEQLILEAGIVT